ncbi:MAG: ABC transporter permease [Anaerolineales bacterium]|nr:ABC transporter permease [Anaerolineales bacterium]
MFVQLLEVFKYREAARLLTLRELQVRYSNSVLGIIWSLLYPLALTLFFSLAFTLVFPSNIPNYPVFFLAALLPWNFFSLAVVSGAGTILNNSPLVNRVRFPREILPLAVVSANAINYLIALIPLALLMLVFGVPFTPALLWLPVLLAVQFAFVLGLVLALSALNVFLRDVQQIVEVLMLPLFFLTPIVYSYSNSPVSASLQQLALIANPMAGLVTQYRRIIYSGIAPEWPLLGITALEALVALLAGLFIFNRLSPYFADEL